MAQSNHGNIRVEAVPRLRPTVSIYQNPDHVAGILQQLHVAPLVQDESREQGSAESSSEKSDSKGEAGERADARLPGVGGAAVNVSGGHGTVLDSGMKADSKVVQRFTYSQAFYLFEVRDALWRRNQIRNVSSAAEAEQLEVGDFVEFQASFRPNELHAVLDILTADLVGKIVEHNRRKYWLDSAPEFDDFEKHKVYAGKVESRVRGAVEVATAALEAIRIDFRAAKTREFYGDIDDVTAITICDSAHFVVEDEDRILDGHFTVLGKVTSPVQEDLPVLDRNKLLDRLSPELIDSIFEMIRDAASKEAFKLDRGQGVKHEINNAVDLALPSRIEGASFKVVPVAIYV